MESLRYRRSTSRIYSNWTPQRIMHRSRLTRTRCKITWIVPFIDCPWLSFTRTPQVSIPYLISNCRGNFTSRITIPILALTMPSPWALAWALSTPAKLITWAELTRFPITIQLVLRTPPPLPPPRWLSRTPSLGRSINPSWEAQPSRWSWNMSLKRTNILALEVEALAPPLSPLKIQGS